MIDLEKILSPVTADAPTGADLRLVTGDTTIDDVEEMRREVDPAVDPAGKGKEPDWPGVVRTCEKSLTTATKDLQLAARLVEGLTQTEGFPGLHQGLEMVSGLLEQHWDGLHPGLEDGEIIEPLRARWIAWLGSSQEFLHVIKRVPITSAAGAEPLAWLDYEESVRLEQARAFGDEAAYNEMVEAGRTTTDQWRQSFAATPVERISAVVQTLGAAIEEVEALDRRASERFSDPPVLVGLRDCLQEMEAYVRSQLPGDEPQAGALPGEAAPAGASAAAGAEAGQGGAIRSRDDAYARLREVASYLKRTEPHSPVPALIDRAIRWRDLSFADLLNDVLKEKDAKKTVMDLLGIKDAEG